LSASVLSLILQGIDKSKQLLDFAESGDWEAFNQLEAQRQSELSAIQLQGLDLNEAQYAEINDQMQILIDLNTKLEQVCRQQRSDLTEEMKKFTKSNKAIKAYSR
jgi:putative cell wall-binding protein